MSHRCHQRGLQLCQQLYYSSIVSLIAHSQQLKLHLLKNQTHISLQHKQITDISMKKVTSSDSNFSNFLTLDFQIHPPAPTSV